MASIKSILFIMSVAACTIATANYLDPAVFRTIGDQQLQTPPLHHQFNLSFRMNTFENRIHEVLPRNASYQVRKPTASEDGIITLNIPLHHVSMRGMYFTTLGWTHGNQTTILQNNTGSYRMLMSDLDFRFRINFALTYYGILMVTEECHTNIGDIDFTLSELDITPKAIQLSTVKHLMEMEVKDQYSRMFCDTLNAITSRAVPSPLYEAIGHRISGALDSFQKSG